MRIACGGAVATLHLRYEGAAIMPRPAFSEIEIWDIADRGQVLDRDDIEGLLRLNATKRAVTTIDPPGLKPMAVEEWAAIARGRWIRAMATQDVIATVAKRYRMREAVASRRLLEKIRACRQLPFQKPSVVGLTGWYARASELIRHKNYTMEAAVEDVVLHYLRKGDFRPLFDSCRRNYIHSGKVKKCLADLLVGADKIRVGVNLIRKKKPGRKKISKWEETELIILNRGVASLEAGEEPSRLFWHFLWAALEKERRKTVVHYSPAAFSIQAKIEGRGRGNPPDPDREMRDKVLGWLVWARAQEIEKSGRRIDLRWGIIPAVTREWNAQVSDEAKVGESVVALAYKNYKPTGIRKSYTRRKKRN
jgi:hypothetical protein